MATLAVVVGGGFGVLLRMFAERLRLAGRDLARWNSLTLTVSGAFLLGVGTGIAWSMGGAGGIGAGEVALSSALFTYCVFSGAAIHLAGDAGDRSSGMAAVATTGVHAVSGLAAAVPGVVLALWAAGARSWRESGGDN